MFLKVWNSKQGTQRSKLTVLKLKIFWQEFYAKATEFVDWFPFSSKKKQSLELY